MLRKLYLSPLGILISAILNALAMFHRPFMVYGYRDRVARTLRKRTRISSTAVLTDKDKIAIGDNVWIWHHSIIDGSNGVTVGEGCQIGAWVGIFSHGSQLAIRLHGKNYIEICREDRIGYTRGPVTIGPYSFIGAGAYVLPGVSIGKGCIVAAGAVVSSSIPDFAIARGNPAKIVGDVRALDTKFMDHELIRESYFDSAGMAEWQKAQENKTRNFSD